MVAVLPEVLVEVVPRAEVHPAGRAVRRPVRAVVRGLHVDPEAAPLFVHFVAFLTFVCGLDLPVDAAE